jgi:ketosteroid isomerase-like protein
MSQHNVEIVRMLQPTGVDLVALFEGDQQPLAQLPLSLFADDFASSFIAIDAAMTLGPGRGIEGFSAGWRNWLEAWERYEIEAEEFIDAGDRVVVFAHIRGRTRRDGVEMEHAPAAVWSLRDGAVCHVEFYLDRDEALRAAGLAK